MGNYLSSLQYIKTGYLPENNNAMNDNVAEKIDQPRVAPKIFHLNSVDAPSVFVTKGLQNQPKIDCSIVLNLWQRLYSLFNYQFAPPEIDITEDNSQSNLFEGNTQINSSEKRNRTIFIKPTCQRLCGKDLEIQESGKFNSLRRKTKLPSPVDCFNRSQDRTFANCILQRLDSGIEDTSLAFSARTQIDVDGLFLTTMVTMPDNRQCCAIDENLKNKMVCHKSISFFIDIRDPLRQKPLCEDYRFSTFEECDSIFSYDSMFSDQFSENSDENCTDDDFIVFGEDILDEDAAYDFDFTLNNACTPAELSYCVCANSTTCVDICLNTSPMIVHSTCPRKLTSESSMSVKIDICPYGNGKTYEADAIHNKCPKDNGCLDPNCSSTSETTSEKTYRTRIRTSTNYFDASTTSEKCAKVEESCSFNTDCCVDSGITPGKKKSRKKVCFEKDDDLVVVYEMRHWDFAYREARKGPWELAAVDRCRFRRRIQELQSILTPCLKRKLRQIQET